MHGHLWLTDAHELLNLLGPYGNAGLMSKMPGTHF